MGKVVQVCINRKFGKGNCLSLEKFALPEKVNVLPVGR